MQVLPGELLVLPDVGRHHPPDPLGDQQPTQPPVVDAAVVRHRLEVVGALLEQRLDQHRRDAAQPEPADRQRRRRWRCRRPPRPHSPPPCPPNNLLVRPSCSLRNGCDPSHVAAPGAGPGSGSARARLGRIVSPTAEIDWAGIRLSPAFTTVESPRRSLSQMTVTAQNPSPPAQTNTRAVLWPQSVRDYVQRAFVPDTLLPNVTRQEMEEQLKLTITNAAQSGELNTIDWVHYPLPQQIVQQNRNLAAQSYNRQATWPQIAFQPASLQQQSPPGHNKKRSFDDLTTADSANPPWKKGSKSGNGAFEGRITYANKSQATRMEKRLKKSQTMEPSSKFQADLDKRRQRFELDKTPHHSWSSDDEEAGSGPVIGTCQTVLKSYYRLTSAPKPENVRPQPILEQALEILKKKWREVSDYNYVCDQLKPIRQDLTVQRIKNSFLSKSIRRMHSLPWKRGIWVSITNVRHNFEAFTLQNLVDVQLNLWPIVYCISFIRRIAPA